MTILTIVLAITGVFEGGGATGRSPPKDERILKNGQRLADVLKRLAGQTVETLPTIVGNIVGAILSKVIGFVAERTWMDPNYFCCRIYWCVVDARG